MFSDTVLCKPTCCLLVSVRNWVSKFIIIYILGKKNWSFFFKPHHFYFSLEEKSPSSITPPIRVLKSLKLLVLGASTLEPFECKRAKGFWINVELLGKTLAAALTFSNCTHTSGAFGAWSNGMVACLRGWYPLTCCNRTWMDNRYGKWLEVTGRFHSCAAQCWSCSTFCSFACNYRWPWVTLATLMKLTK